MTVEDTRVMQLETAVRDLVERLGETNTSLGSVATKLDMYMAERERSDERARRYQEVHDRACEQCSERLHSEITRAATAEPFTDWANRYKVLGAIFLALFIMFGRDLGQALVGWIAQGG